MRKLFSTLVLLCLACMASTAFAKNCNVAISGDDAMKFDRTEIRIDAACTQVSVTLTHTGKLAANVMGHDWVLARTADMAGIDADGMKAGMAAGFIKAGDERVIAHTKVIGGGQRDTVTFSTSKLTKGGDYSFFCSFPGHAMLMKGKFVFG
ncbi:azurin [Pseudoxanthomonas winnipegensis]|uniref:azurin n=1 Tax=Pseudoxanthomonas winnipegensis TaxID=2480810 RepID=UPI00257507C1|nr:azurin [Pseudoxanthomonas winnipegensis]WJI15788.1 azurin [Pseudoxanthomonas winnipegensis]